MVSAQITRLKKDSENLETFIQQLTAEGDMVRAAKIANKKNYLDNHIAEIQLV